MCIAPPVLSRAGRQGQSCSVVPKGCDGVVRNAGDTAVVYSRYHGRRSRSIVVGCARAPVPVRLVVVSCQACFLARIWLQQTHCSLPHCSCALPIPISAPPPPPPVRGTPCCCPRTRRPLSASNVWRPHPASLCAPWLAVADPPQQQQ